MAGPSIDGGLNKSEITTTMISDNTASTTAETKEIHTASVIFEDEKEGPSTLAKICSISCYIFYLIFILALVLATTYKIIVDSKPPIVPAAVGSCSDP